MLFIGLWPLLAGLLFAGAVQGGLRVAAYAALLYLSLALVVVEHNHMHLRMWHSRRLNRLTDTALGLITGHPTFVFYPTHNSNHHRHHHGEQDVARTYRFSGGDTNHLWGYLMHPCQALAVLWPVVTAWLARLRRRSPNVYRYYLCQWAGLLAVSAALAVWDFKAWLLFVLLPQALGLHWLLGANYLQHAHANGDSKWHSARNFLGSVNPLFFNIGFHTVHHRQPRLHWSALPQAHAQCADQIDPRLMEPSLLRYAFFTLALGPLSPRWRSQSLRPINHTLSD